MKTFRFSELPSRRQQLVRLCQALNFGAIRDIRLEDGEPVLIAASVLVEERLDLPEEQRPEIQLDDFNLSKEWRRLFARFDAVQNGSIKRLTVLAGIPRRVIFESRMSEIDRKTG
jgi:hypothetical protein